MIKFCSEGRMRIVGVGRTWGQGREKEGGGNKGGSIRNWRTCESGTVLEMRNCGDSHRSVPDIREM